MLDLAGLREGQRLKQLIERAKAAGEDDETAGVLDEPVRAAEHGHGGSDVVESVKALDELGEDAQHAPRVGVVAELLDCAALEQRAVGGGLLAGDDQPTGAAAVSAVPATGLVHQAPAVFGFGVPTSEAPLVTTTAISGSSAELRSPLDEAGSASIATGRSGSI